MPSDDIVWREVGHIVAKRRTDVGIATQVELAQRAQVHLNTVSRLERGVLRRQGRSWAAIEAVLQWPAGTIADTARRMMQEPGQLLTAAVLEKAVLDAIDDAAPHVTVRQARRIVDGVVGRLEHSGILPPGATNR